MTTVSADQAQFAVVTHNGMITVTNPQSGEHRTFRIKTQKKKARFAPGKRILGLLTGSDNVNDYTQFAFVNDDGRVFVWNKFKGTKYERYARLIENLPAECERWKLQVQWSAKCRCCNKDLTDPVSIELGIGPVCRGEE